MPHALGMIQSNQRGKIQHALTRRAPTTTAAASAAAVHLELGVGPASADAEGQQEKPSGPADDCRVEGGWVGPGCSLLCGAQARTTNRLQHALGN